MIAAAAVFLAILMMTVAVFLLMENRMRSSDLNSIKNRLLGTARSKRNKRTAAAPALINTDDRQTTSLAVRILGKLELRDWLQNLIEQAGMKWKVAHFARISLTLLLGASCLVWYA